MSQQTSTNVEPQQPPAPAPAPAKAKVIDFGNGRYSQAMKELFGDSQRLLGITEKQAEKLARSFGAELGRYNLHSKISFGKYSAKSNQITLKESASLKGLVVTYPISMAKLCILMQECIAFGLDVENSTIELQSAWAAWLNE